MVRRGQRPPHIARIREPTALLFLALVQPRVLYLQTPPRQPRQGDRDHAAAPHYPGSRTRQQGGGQQTIPHPPPRGERGGGPDGRPLSAGRRQPAERDPELTAIDGPPARPAHI